MYSNRNYQRIEISASLRLNVQLAINVALDQVEYENEARGSKSLKMQALSRCNESTIVDGAVKNPNRTGCNVIETISVLKFPQVEGSLQLAINVAQDQVAYENEATGLKSLKLAFSRCNGGTIVDGAGKILIVQALT